LCFNFRMRGFVQNIAFLHIPSVRYALVAFSNILQIYIFTAGVFYFFTSFFGLKRRREHMITCPVKKRFALIVPAYNEESVIACAADSLLKIKYPRELFDIYVAADHCTDRTVEIARAHGALVYEHKGDCPRGKSRALQALDEYLLSTGKYDAFCYFDADSLAHPDFLEAMNARLNRGEQAIQACEHSKNWNVNWLSRICHVGQVLQVYYGQMPKHRLGFSATLHGKGMCFTADIMRRFAWDPRALTEDIEFQANLVRHGVRIHYAPEAIVYDESPTQIIQMIYRSIRWTKGALYVANKHIGGLLRRALKHRDMRALESFVRFSMCYRFIFVGLIAIFMYVYRDAFSLLFWVFDHPPGRRFTVKLMNWIPVYLWPAYAVYREKGSWRLYAAYLMMPWFYLCLGVPIFFVSLYSYRRKGEWFRTEHTCPVEIADILPPTM